MTSWVFSKIPLSILGNLIRTNLVIPYYHVVSNKKIPHIIHLYDYKNINQFENDMDFFLKNYSPISLFDLINHLKNKNLLREKVFLLTFDDGFREMYDIVAPILFKKGIPATFFINSAFIDNKELFYQHKTSILIEHFQKIGYSNLKKEIKEILQKNCEGLKNIRSSILSVKYHQKDILDRIALLVNIDFNDYLSKNQPYLTSSQINGLIKDGFTIGSHSIDHPLYSSISMKDQLYQTIESVKQIRERFCLDYSAFAFPHSDNNVSEQFFIELYNSKWVDISFGTSGMIEDSFPRNLQRISLEKPLMPAKEIIAYQYARRFVRLTKGNSKINRI